jgi:predicted acyltransferase
MVVGWTWSFWFPINKALWTSSYVLLTAGLALQFLAVCFWLIDIKGVRRWATPFVVFGSNALIIYFLAELFSRIISLVSFTRPDGSGLDLKTLIYEKIFASWASPVNASVLFAICVVLLWLGVAAILYRKRIFIKV